MSSAPVVLYCRRCGKSFTRRMGEGIHRRSPKRKPLAKLNGPASVVPVKRPSWLPAAPPVTALRKVPPKP